MVSVERASNRNTPPNRLTREFWDLYQQQGRRQDEPYPRCDARTENGTAKALFLLARAAYVEVLTGSLQLTINLEVGFGLLKALRAKTATLSCQVGGIACEGSVSNCSVRQSSMSGWVEIAFRDEGAAQIHLQCEVREASPLAELLKSRIRLGPLERRAADGVPVWTLLRDEKGPWCSSLAHFPLRAIGPIQGPAIRPTKLGAYTAVVSLGVNVQTLCGAQFVPTCALCSQNYQPISSNSQLSSARSHTTHTQQYSHTHARAGACLAVLRGKPRFTGEYMRHYKRLGVDQVRLRFALPSAKRGIVILQMLIRSTLT
jgi:hypothetical protein